MTRPEELLAQHPLFLRLKPEQIARFAAIGDAERYEAGEPVVREGTPSDAMYLILEGELAVERGETRLGVLGPGDFFGEMALLEPAPRSATVRAVDPAHVFRLPYFTLQNLLEDDTMAFNRVLVAIVRVLSERVRHANDLLTHLGGHDEEVGGSLV